MEQAIIIGVFIGAVVGSMISILIAMAPLARRIANLNLKLLPESINRGGAITDSINQAAKTTAAGLLQAQNEKHEQERITLMEMINSLNRRLSTSDDRVQTLEAQSAQTKERYEDELKDLRQDYAALERKVFTLEHERNDLVRERNDALKQVQHLTQEQAKLVRRLTENQEQIHKLELAMASLEASNRTLETFFRRIHFVTVTTDPASALTEALSTESTESKSEEPQPGV